MLPSVTFSSLEKIIINPILTLRAPLPVTPNNEPATFGAIIKQGFDSFVAARVVAVFSSLFAAADAAVHLGTGIVKGLCLQDRSVVIAHVRQALTFAGFATVLSLAAVIWPDVVRYCRYVPEAPTDACDGAPHHLKDLAERVRQGLETAPFHEVKAAWEQASLEEKHWIVRLFSQDGSSHFATVRTTFKDTIFQPVTAYSSRKIEWISPQEVDTRISKVWQGASQYNHSFFYHATSEASLEAILKSKKVEVRHEKAFRGAYVSTTPETGFGRCILAFKKKIERLSTLEHGFPLSHAYWAGFSRDIPVTESTLAYIILDDGSYQECQSLQDRCSAWLGKPISVISLRDAKEHLGNIKDLKMGIPIEWPSVSRDNRMNETILMTLQARATVAVQARVSLKVRLVALAQRVFQWIQLAVANKVVVRERQRVLMYA